MCDQTVFCPSCDAENSLEEFSYNREIEYRGSTILVEGLKANFCRVCQEEPVLEGQIRENRARYCDAKRRSDGLLTGTEIVAIRESLELTQSGASKLFGGGANAFSKYERGEVSQSSAMDSLIRLSSEFSVVEIWLREKAGFDIRSFKNEEYKQDNQKIVRFERAGVLKARNLSLASHGEYREVG